MLAKFVNTFGSLFKITTFGESYSKAVGIVIDGMPPKVKIDLKKLQKEVNRRKSTNFWDSNRKEDDLVEVLSGIYEGYTLGTPIAIIIKNQTVKHNYSKNLFRPGHADATTLLKYGIRDHRGGGRASARETVSRVIASYFASLIIPNILIDCKIVTIGGIPYTKSKKIEEFLTKCKKEGESLSSEVKVVIRNMISKLGDPIFNKLKATLGHAIFSIPGVTGLDFGNRSIFLNQKGSDLIKKKSNFSGIEGGISNGDDISLNVLFRAPSSVGSFAKQGHHDVAIAFRGMVVIEAMIKIVLADHFLVQKAINK